MKDDPQYTAAKILAMPMQCRHHTCTLLPSNGLFWQVWTTKPCTPARWDILSRSQRAASVCENVNVRQLQHIRQL